VNGVPASLLPIRLPEVDGAEDWWHFAAGGPLGRTGAQVLDEFDEAAHVGGDAENADRKMRFIAAGPTYLGMHRLPVQKSHDANSGCCCSTTGHSRG